jgi:hypothetical protein
MADRNVFWDLVNTITHDHIQPTVVDAIFTDNATYATLEANNRVVVRGGDSITWPVMFDKLNFVTYRGMTPFPSQEKQIQKRALVEWKQAAVDIVVSSFDAKRARGPLAVMDLMEELRQAATLAAADGMGTQLYGDGTGNSGLDLDGAKVGMDDGTAYDSYAGFSRSSYSWWKGNVDSTGGAWTTSSTNTSYGSATIGNQHPNLITTTQTLWNKAWERVQPQQRFEAGDERNRSARIGFDAIRFNGADLVHDAHSPSGYQTHWNTDWMELRVQEDSMFDWTGWKNPTAQDGQQGQLVFMGNFVFTNPRMFAIQTGLT